MFNVALLIHVIVIAMFFILIVTQAWKKSITTTIFITSLVIAIECYGTYSKNVSYFIVLFGALLALSRAIINHDEDKIIKRN